MKYRLICLIISTLLIFTSCGMLGKSSSKPAEPLKTVNKAAAEESSNAKPSSEKSSQDVPASSENSSKDTSALNSSEKNWYYEVKSNGEPSGEPQSVLDLINKYNAYYLGDTSKKEIYLTFDEGYENGYTADILDILKENNVKAAFFVTKPYITGNKELILRMVNEGHLVCNHSNTHPSMPSVALKGISSFEKEFTDTEEAFTAVTGKPMPKFFRPPMGNYSELSLFYTKSLGYKSIFWSFAYRDWLVDDQPAESYAADLMKKRTHNGGIFLLHAVSKTNTNILDSMLKEWKSQGYEFKTLYELPAK